MGETRGYLFVGEDVALVVRPHPVVLFRPLLWPLGAIALFAAFTNTFFFVLLLAALVKFGWSATQWWLDRFALTTDRILSTSGIFSKKVVSLPLAKITDLTYERSFGGRILGYGKLDLESSGLHGLERIDYLPDPDYFYRAVMSLALGPKRNSVNAQDNNN
jgi:hypothetical protein